MNETLNFDFCNMTIYDHYVIVVVNEGVIVSTEHNNTLIKITETYFPNKPFVYITHRIHSYSVNPEVYSKTAQIKNLIGLVVVSKNYQAKINAKIEKMFFKKPFEIFSELDDAKAWAEDLVAEK
ncbi:hypothetical protein ITJ86_09085 [Winogradskyella sp. F6397]|uniref:STAS/SEC14 domain-containing protein n=1 Tax=Winogradskyella marina TaxID=2785530 RepID=A0ABS0EIG4_9FLAO|nr:MULTISPECIES: hypothetical protein [Winogradskyella]MBF8150048.1 hypothetical protein [Winogradskyella marina]